MGGTKFIEQAWDHQGVVLRQPAVAPQGEARDFTWIATELAHRTGLIEPYNNALNRGAGCMPLKGANYDFTLQTDVVHDVDTIWNAACKAATAEFTDGKDIKDLEWFKEHGYFVVPFKRVDWYLYPTMVEKGLRFELPYQERLLRVGKELANRLHEQDIRWWDAQLTEYEAIPQWHDVPGIWIKALRKAGADPDDYPFWGITCKMMQYTTGNNVAIQLMDEVAGNVRGHGRILLNAGVARRLGIARDDLIEVRSITNVTRGRAEPAEGVRPDTIVIPGQFDHWATPYAKELAFPSLNTVAPLSMDLTDSTGSGADVVRVAVTRIGGAEE